VLARVLEGIGKGDTLVVVRIDRLARSLSHLLEVIERLKATIKGADPKITLQAICTRLKAMRECTPRSRPTSKQVAFAERLARIKRRAVPDECFRDKGLMSKWIDGNK
jgi:hypothetical protein